MGICSESNAAPTMIRAIILFDLQGTSLCWGLKLKTVRTIGDSSLRAMIRDARVRLVFAAIFAHGEGKAG